MAKKEFKDLKDIKLFLFDLDGTINMGNVPIPGAIEALNVLDRIGKKVCFVTNNSSKATEDYVKKLHNLGYNARPEQIVTSGMATAQFISRRRPYKSVYVLGTPSLCAELREYGVEIRELHEDADIVVLGFDTSLTYEKLWHACILLEHGKDYIVTHPDFVCPSDLGDMPDTGSMMLMIEKTTGRTPEVVIGKPCAPMAEFVFDHYSVNPEDVAMVGDRLYTDIKFGLNNNMTSILVLTGETDLDALFKSDIKPDIVLEGVRNLAALEKYL